MTKLLLIAAGGAVGAVLRYVVSGLTYRLFDETFPWGTLAVNLLGSFVIGLVWAVLERVVLSPKLTTFLFIGVLGAFTTFSTYSLESFHLLRDGEVRLGLVNILASNVLGLALVYVGFVCARYLLDLLK
ncbi:MAG: fluoride efflux transporter CrcB [Rhodothermales bacterium]